MSRSFIMSCGAFVDALLGGSSLLHETGQVGTTSLVVYSAAAVASLLFCASQLGMDAFEQPDSHKPPSNQANFSMDV